MKSHTQSGILLKIKALFVENIQVFENILFQKIVNNYKADTTLNKKNYTRKYYALVIKLNMHCVIKKNNKHYIFMAKNYKNLIFFQKF